MCLLRRLIVPAALASMELIWVYALLLLAAGFTTGSGMMGGGGAPPAAGGVHVATRWLLLMLVVSWGMALVLRKALMHPVTACMLSWLVWVLVTLVAVKALVFPATAWNDPVWLLALPRGLAGALRGLDAALLVALAGGLLWWLGRRLAFVRPGPGLVVSEFQFGLAMLGAILFLGYVLGREPSGAISLGVLYVAVGLVGAAAANALGGGGWTARLEQGPWWGMLLVSVALVLLLGLCVGAVMTPDLIGLVLRWLGWVWRRVDGAFRAFADLFDGDAAGPAPGVVPLTTTTEAVPSDTFGFSFKLPIWLTGGARLLWTILVAGVALLAVWRVTSQLLGRFRHLPADGRGDVEPLKGVFRLDLVRWLRRTAARLFGFGRRSAARIHVVPTSAEATSVRALYARFLGWAAAAGVPWERGQTPLELERLLVEALPEHANEFRIITRQYLKVRYGGLTPTDEDLNEVAKAWRTMRKG